MLKVNNVMKKFGDFTAVDDLSFEVQEGEVFGLLGLNGAGKTTTFRMILNIFEPTSGEISYFGNKIDYSNSDEVGFLPEERSLIKKYTVYNQLKFFGNLKSMEKSTIDKEIDYWLKRFNCEKYRNLKIKELSKGNKQKIQFISSVINNPKLLILDEPFSGLDPINVELFKNAIDYLSSKKTMIIFSSHRMDHVELFCKNLIVLVKGKVLLQGNIDNIKDSFKKKNILINADIEKDVLKNIEGVIDVVDHGSDLLVKISDMKYRDAVYNSLKDCKDILKFVVERPTLNEIFIEKVGAAYE